MDQEKAPNSAAQRYREFLRDEAFVAWSASPVGEPGATDAARFFSTFWNKWTALHDDFLVTFSDPRGAIDSEPRGPESTPEKFTEKMTAETTTAMLLKKRERLVSSCLQLLKACKATESETQTFKSCILRHDEVFEALVIELARSVSEQLTDARNRHKVLNAYAQAVSY